MKVTIRVPGHPVALASVMGGLDLESPEIEPGRGEWWLRFHVDDTPPALNHALEALVRLNTTLMRAWMAQGHAVPNVYQLAALSGFRYKPEPKGREWWQTWIDNVAERSGDCEDLAGHQAAWNRAVLGVPAWARTKKTAPRVYHAIVEHLGGVVEDPSLPLGLAEQRARRRAARARKAA